MSSSKPDDAAAEGPATDAPPPVPVISTIRTVDRALGHCELAVLVFCLVTLIGVASIQAVASLLFGISWTWSFEIIRYSVFFIAMAGAALAAQNERLISMDFVSRMLSRRARAWVRLVLRSFTIFACALLAYGGYLVQAKVAAEPSHYEIMSDADATWALPVGAVLIGLHVLLHLIVDVLYLSKGELPPEDAGVAVH